MSLTTIVAAATSALAPLLYRSCSVTKPTLTISTETWGSAVVCDCMYEESSPSQQGVLAYQDAAGYGYDVWIKPSVTFADGSAISGGAKITSDGMEFVVIEAAKVGAPGPLRRLRVRRVA